MTQRKDKSNVTATGPEIYIFQLVNKVGTTFQRLKDMPMCFLGLATFLNKMEHFATFLDVENARWPVATLKPELRILPFHNQQISNI